MIKEFEFYHGLVFSTLLHIGKVPIKVSQYPSPDNASYVVNEEVDVYI